MDKKRESILLKADDIRITPRKVMIGLESYQISDIRSVNVEEKNLNPIAGKAVIIASFISLIAGIVFCLATFTIRFIPMPAFFSDWPRINVGFLIAGIIQIIIRAINDAMANQGEGNFCM